MLTNNILIIDDSMTDYVVMKSLLKKANENYRIIHNADGLSVMDIIISEDIDLIILDLMIDTVDGVDILKKVKTNQITEDIPVIICSSITERNMIKRTLSLGAYDYFEKPLSDMAIAFGFEIKVKNALKSKQYIEDVNYLKNHDELTGLYTRKYFELEIQKLIANQCLPVGVVILDINGLKVINDAYGHDYGDAILMKIGNVLQLFCDKQLCAARWGGDEIAMLLSNADEEQIGELISKLNSKIIMEKESVFDITYGWAIEKDNITNTKYIIQRAEDNLCSNKILESSSVRSKMIDTILKTLHQKNPREERHSHRVSAISKKIAHKLGVSEYELKKVAMAGLLHDIGKISIDEKILNKPSALNDKEWDEIKKHPEHGFKILSISVDTLEIAKAILAHHERWDGLGYPKGLKESEIPIMARIIAVADSFDAMTSVRAYNPGISEEKAVQEIISCSGSHYDPVVVDAFLEYYKETKSRNHIQL